MFPRRFIFFCLVFSVATLAGCGNKPAGVVVSPPPAAAPAASLTLSITPSAVLPGQYATLTWKSGNASACTGSGAWTGVQATAGSMNVRLDTPASQSYVLLCTGDGTPATQTVNLQMDPSAMACAAHPAAVDHSSRRTIRRSKPTGTHS
jgi:hypothetical protein